MVRSEENLTILGLTAGTTIRTKDPFPPVKNKPEFVLLALVLHQQNLSFSTFYLKKR
jgi:hypothetical protein